MTKPEITKDIYIEELVNHYPFSVRFLSEKGIKCIACGEPIWGTLEEAMQEKGFLAKELETVIFELNQLASKE
jgi:methionine synthase II (cobalamin-independent)